MLMRAMAGLIKPNEGEIIVDGKTLWDDVSFPESIGMLIENPAFLDNYTGYQNLYMLASIKCIIDEESIRQTMREVGLNPLEKKKYRKYSLGMKQRLGIAAALMESPSIILLDEPTNALDAQGVEIAKKLILAEKDRGASIVISCHDKDILEYLSDEIYYMSEGCIIDHRISKKVAG